MTDNEYCSNKCGSGDHKRHTASRIQISRLFNLLFFFENGDIDDIEFTITIYISRVFRGMPRTSDSFNLANYIFINSSAMGI